MIRELREDAVEQGFPEPQWRAGLGVFAAVAARPRVWRALEALALPLLRLVPLDSARLRGRGPLAPWTRERDFPRGEGRSYRAAWDEAARETASDVREPGGTAADAARSAGGSGGRRGA